MIPWFPAKRGLAAPSVAVVMVVCLAALSAATGQDAVGKPQFELAPLASSSESPDPRQVELGKMLFFDSRLSGDATVSCATCHKPDQAWCDGMELARGYPGSLYFRNTPSILNVVFEKYVYWDGRLPADDLATVVRDHIAEAHFMQADGRLVIERMRQIPEYSKRFRNAFDGEPTYGRILNSIAAFVRTLKSEDVPLDRFLNGDEQALSDQAKRGLELFRGKAGCIECHHGPMLTDSRFYNVGAAANKEIFKSPLRHITFRRFLRTLGVSEFEHVRRDVGRYAVSKMADDMGRFRTPTLREVSRTGPYMHNGTLATLEDVVAFFNQGGGDAKGRDSRLRPLNLTAQQQSDLVAFLKTLAGRPGEYKVPEMPPYELREKGAAK